MYAMEFGSCGKQMVGHTFPSPWLGILIVSQGDIIPLKVTSAVFWKSLLRSTSLASQNGEEGRRHS